MKKTVRVLVVDRKDNELLRKLFQIISGGTYYKFKEQKHGEVDSAMLKNICNWAKCVHEAIFEVARSDHVVTKKSHRGA